jgi:arginine/lysine/ornithine decarboxylase
MLKFDITEIPGADNLLNPEGAIKESQELHTAFIDAAQVCYTTGGSSAGIMAMLSMFRGKKVIFPRGVHLSAANAVFMLGITPVYLNSPPCDFPSVVSEEDIKSALRAHRDAAAVFIVYPNYFGLCCDIEAIAEAVHRFGIPLLVDAAHAAHFVYSPLLPLAPSHAGADIWVESAHKTLPAMNQCASLCVGKGALVDTGEVKHALNAFQTTSPSYILLASLDYAHSYMRDKGEQELFRIINLGRKFEETVNSLPGFFCVEMTGIAQDRDCLKVAIDVSGTGHTGLSVKNMLAGQGIYVESADMKHILVMLSVGNSSAHLDILADALGKIESVRSGGIYFSPYSMPPATKYSQNSRFWGSIESVRIEQSVGRICASTAGVYPPAEVVIHRGQVMSYETAGYLLEAKRQGFDVFGTIGDSIRVYKERT